MRGIHLIRLNIAACQFSMMWLLFKKMIIGKIVELIIILANDTRSISWRILKTIFEIFDYDSMLRIEGVETLCTSDAISFS
jgi:hypothetical protein